MNPPVVEELPPLAPRTRHPMARRMARAILRLSGWRLEGTFADLPRLVLIAAPHSTGWDAVWGLLVKIALGLDIRFMAKQELFWWPLGPFLSALGAIPVDRASPKGAVGQAADYIRAHDTAWFLLAPEGTRRHVKTWKTGFWHIARAAGVPVQAIYFHYPDKRIGLGPTFEMTPDMKGDVERVREFYRPWMGKYHGL